MRGASVKRNNISSELANAFAKANIKSNFILISTMAVSITALFVMMSLVRGRIQADGIRTIRENGSAAAVILDNGSEEQYLNLLNLSYVSEAGAVKEFGYCYQNGKTLYSCNIVEEEDFQKIILPAYENFTGNYPQNIDEIMLSTRILESLGIEQPEIGMDIPSHIVQYNWIQTGVEDIKRSFHLSGYYTDYVTDLDKLPAAYFSKSFFSELSTDFYPANIFIKSDDIWFSRKQMEERFYQDVKLDISQNFQVINEGISHTLQNMAGGILISIAGAMLIFLSMALFIYNIFSISLERYKKNYGLLKIIGATPKQVQKIFLLQSFKIIVIGSVLGGICGSILVKSVVPRLIEKMYLAGLGSAERLEVYSLKLLILSVCIAGVGVLAAFWHCIHTMMKLSPMECLRSKQKTTGLKKIYKSKKGTSILLMAWRNFTRNRKKVSITIASVFLGIEVSLLSIVIIGGLDRTNEIRQNPDFEIGVTKEAVAEYILMNNGRNLDSIIGHELLLEEMISYITESFKIEPESMAECIGSYGIFGYRSEAMVPIRHSQKNGGKDIITELTVQVVPDEWINRLSQYISEKEFNIDLDTFENNNGFILLHKNELSEQQEMEAEKVIGKNLSGLLIEDGGKEIEFVCCGYLDTTNKGFPVLNMPWNGKNLNYVIISSKTMESYNIQPVTYQVSFDVAAEDESKIKSIIQSLLIEENQQSESGNLYYLTANSAILAKEQSYIFATRIVMGTFCGILLVFSILSYCNTVITDLMDRRIEFAIMQSIGMTKRQMLNMLLGEGAFFCVSILILLSTAGNIIIVITEKFVQQQNDYFKFSIPLIPFLIFAVLLAVISITIPIAIYLGMKKESVVDRLRNIESRG